jgi:hypothetical protein
VEHERRLAIDPSIKVAEGLLFAKASLALSVTVMETVTA